MIEKAAGCISLGMAVILAYFDVSALAVLPLVVAGIFILAGEMQ